MKFIKPYEIKGKSGTLIDLYIQPGASKPMLRGIYQDRLKLSVTSPPVRGAANIAVLEFLSEILKIPVKKITLLKGETSRQKTVWIDQETKKTEETLNRLIHEKDTCKN